MVVPDHKTDHIKLAQELLSNLLLFTIIARVWDHQLDLEAKLVMLSAKH
jgi:hypothetical protein